MTAIVPAEEDAAQVALGQVLFFDKILSGNRNISCSTCHLPEAATGDALPVSIGEGGSGRALERVAPTDSAGAEVLIPRNAPDVFNRGTMQDHVLGRARGAGRRRVCLAGGRDLACRFG
jgi:cytochrome c peroxidase